MLSDFQYAVRKLARNPGFALGIVLTLAFAIGANTAEFSLTRAVLVKPLPWPNADRLVMVWNTLPSIGWQEGPVAIPDYLDRRNKTDCFSDSALFSPIILNLSSETFPEHLSGLRVTPSYFSTLGAIPAEGRLFSADDTVPGREKETVISYDLWHSRFASQKGIVGTDIRMNGEQYRVVGIMPRGFVAPNLSMPSIDEPTIELWVPYAFTADEMSDKGRGIWQSFMIARLRDGVKLEQAQQQVDGLYQDLSDPANRSVIARKAGGFGGFVAGYREQNVRQIRPMILVLQAAVALLFLIACANVANLLLIRGIARRKELAIRLALGSGRLRVARQLLTENLVLALAGGALGLLVARWDLDLFGWLYARPWLNRQATFIDGTAVGFDLVLSLGSALFFGAVTSVSLLLKDSGMVLRGENTRGSAGGTSAKTRAGLITAEVALATMLLIAAGLTAKSFIKLQKERPGFTADTVLTARVSLPETGYKDGGAQSSFYKEALLRLRSLPGAISGSLVSFVPFGGSFSTSDYHLGDQKPTQGQPDYNAFIEVIDSEYFRAMQIPLLAGRGFSDSDSETTHPVVIIDQFLAKRRFAKRDPIGLQIRCPDGTAMGNSWRTIVGVVGDVKAAGLAEPIIKETLYFPFTQRPQPSMTLLLKTNGDPRTRVSLLRDVIHQLDPDLPVYDVRTMDQRLSGSLTNFRFPMILFVMFGVTALGLASLGLYGVLAYSVSQRTKEIGIRIALGAQANAILGLIVRSGLSLTLLGIGLGLGGAVALTRLLNSLLFRVSAQDPFTYFAVPSLLCAVALLACYLPARRATRIDALTALRSE